MPSLFIDVYKSVLQTEGVSMRRNKGVRSECDTCRVNNAVVEFDSDERTDEEFRTAQYALTQNRAVIERFRGDERALQMASKRNVQIKKRDGVFHWMKDKAPNKNTSVPFIPLTHAKGKDANSVTIPLHFMMMAMYGAGVCIPLALPWIKTKAHYNCTCSWVGLVLLSKRLGYIPQELSEHVDRGDENISLVSMGFFGTLVSSDLVRSSYISAHFSGHCHGGADGENQHL